MALPMLTAGVAVLAFTDTVVIAVAGSLAWGAAMGDPGVPSHAAEAARAGVDDQTVAGVQADVVRVGGAVAEGDDVADLEALQRHTLQPCHIAFAVRAA